MRSKSLTPLGETEMEVLHLVWECEPATVSDIHERLLQTRKVAYTTVMTVMKNLTTKGFLQYEKRGTQYVYSAARAPGQVQHSLVRSLIDKVFKGSPTALLQTLVRYETLSEADRDELQRIIDDLPDDAPDDAPEKP